MRESVSELSGTAQEIFALTETALLSRAAPTFTCATRPPTLGFAMTQEITFPLFSVRPYSVRRWR